MSGSSVSVHSIRLDFQGAGAVMGAHQHGLLSGDGAVERLGLYNAVMEKAKAHNESGKPDAEFEGKIDIKSTTLKAWIAGATMGILRQAPGANDTHVAVILEAAKALKVSDSVRKKVPQFKPDDTLLELDGEPELELDKESSNPVIDLEASPSDASVEGSASGD